MRAPGAAPGDRTRPATTHREWERLGRGRRAAVAIEEVVEPGAGALERAGGGRHVGEQVADPAGGAGPLVHPDPDARLVGHDLAAPEVSAPARTVPELLRARLRADVLQVAEHAVAA